MVKNSPAMWETWVWSLGWEDPLEKEMAMQSSTLAWRIPWTEEPGRLQFKGSERVRHNWATFTFLSPAPYLSVSHSHLEHLIVFDDSQLIFFSYFFFLKEFLLPSISLNKLKTFTWKSIQINLIFEIHMGAYIFCFFTSVLCLDIFFIHLLLGFFVWNCILIIFPLCSISLNTFISLSIFFIFQLALPLWPPVQNIVLEFWLRMILCAYLGDVENQLFKIAGGLAHSLVKGLWFLFPPA